MYLTELEYQHFKTHFHCTAGSDEQYRVPLNVETPDGEALWTAYVSGEQFHAAVEWLKRWRSQSRPEASAVSPELAVPSQPVRVPPRLAEVR